jgi:hypothetical protein
VVEGLRTNVQALAPVLLAEPRDPNPPEPSSGKNN